jgi:protocatechuate 4,5-dioxygenase, beta chain
MAELVEIMGISHSPNFPGQIAEPNPEPAIVEAAHDYELMRKRMAASKPDVLIVIASDHLNQFFMDNMPAFLIGKAPRAEGPFPHEVRTFGIAPYRARVEIDVAKSMLQAAPKMGVDFSFSDEFRIDHAFTVPLNFIRPEMDLPIVPIFTNVMAPPVPPAQRFFAVGKAIRKIIAGLPSNKRVGVLSSGHLAIEIGGPKEGRSSSDPEFDRRMMNLVGRGDVENVIKEATWENMMASGNVTPGFLNFVLLMGLADGKAPSVSGVRFPKSKGSVPYMAWDNQAGVLP